MLLVNISVFMPVPCCLVTSVIRYEIRMCEVSNFILLFKISLTSWGSLRVHMNLRMDFSISAKKSH